MFGTNPVETGDASMVRNRKRGMTTDRAPWRWPPSLVFQELKSLSQKHVNFRTLWMTTMGMVLVLGGRVSGRAPSEPILSRDRSRCRNGQTVCRTARITTASRRIFAIKVCTGHGIAMYGITWRCCRKVLTVPSPEHHVLQAAGAV